MKHWATIASLIFGCGICAAGPLAVPGIDVSIWTDAGGTPGAFFAAVGTLNDTAVAPGSALYTFDLPVPISLDSNTRYWLYVSQRPAGTGLAWNYGETTLPEYVYYGGNSYPCNTSDGYPFTMAIMAGGVPVFDTSGQLRNDSDQIAPGGLYGGPLGMSFTTGPGGAQVTQVQLGLYTVPEPATFTLLGVPLALLWWRRRKN